MYNRKPLAFALLAVFLASTCAYAQNPPSPTCCERNPGWTVGLESGLTWLATEEVVEARPEYAAAHLSALTWQARTVVAGMSLRYDTGSILRISGGFWSLVSAGDGSLVNLDYLDSSSEAVTHRSVSPAYLAGLGWQLSADFMLLAGAVGDVLVRSFARLEYRGNYHAWRARGGEYEYSGKQGSFDDGEELVRYLVLHQGFDIGVSVELGKMYDGLHGRLGAAVSLLTLIDDRDTHVLSDTDYRLVRAACRRVRTVSGGEFVRAADALHLTCAADNGFDAVYSHDQPMLDAADCFGLEGRDILA